MGGGTMSCDRQGLAVEPGVFGLSLCCAVRPPGSLSVSWVMLLCYTLILCLLGLPLWIYICFLFSFYLGQSEYTFS